MRLSRSIYRIETPDPYVRRHVYSGFNGPWDDFTPGERLKLIETVYASADFCGLTVVAVSAGQRGMDMIVDVPKELKLGREEMLARLRAYHETPTRLVPVMPFDEEDEEQWRCLAQRFGDLGQMVKQVKMLVTRRYHSVHRTRGTIWSARYVDMFVQGGHHTRILSAWMDHEGVRACEYHHPSENPYSTFGLACAGDRRAQDMIRAMFAEGSGEPSWQTARKRYEDFITDESLPPGKPKRTIGRLKPLLGRAEFLRAEVPHFRGGKCFGDEEFCLSFLEQNRSAFTETRTVGGTVIPGQSDPRLCTVRQRKDLRKMNPEAE